MSVTFNSGQLEAIRRHSAQEYPSECCGILLGKADDNAKQVVEVVPLANLRHDPERAQELLYFLREGREQGRLPGALPVFLDSPMAISATRIFERHPECYKGEMKELFREGNDPFHLPELHFTRETADSIAINSINGEAIIMAGSGMCTGGRIRHPLKNNLTRTEASIVFVGYAANGTLARHIIDGAKQVRLFGEEIPVRATIHTIGGFFGQAGQAEQLDWHAQTHASHTILVHRDEEGITLMLWRYWFMQ